jgi:hypothetical protein
VNRQFIGKRHPPQRGEEVIPPSIPQPRDYGVASSSSVTNQAVVD